MIYVTQNTTFVERDLSQRILDKYLDYIESQSVSLFQSSFFSITLEISASPEYDIAQSLYQCLSRYLPCSNKIELELRDLKVGMFNSMDCEIIDVRMYFVVSGPQRMRVKEGEYSH